MCSNNIITFDYRDYDGEHQFTENLKADDIDLMTLGCYYNIQWKECLCMKGIRLEDVTPELEEKAYNEMQKGFDVK